MTLDRSHDDWRAIEQVLYDYAWMVDQRKWDMMDKVFAPGATIDYESTGGQKGPYRPTLEWLHRALAPWPINLHHITNVQIEVNGDRADARCYFLAPMARKQSRRRAGRDHQRGLLPGCPRAHRRRLAHQGTCLPSDRAHRPAAQRLRNPRMSHGAGSTDRADLAGILGTEFPLIQAPMAGVQDSALAIAVASAGGLGSLPARAAGAGDLRTSSPRSRPRTRRPVQRELLLPRAAARRTGSASCVARSCCAPYFAEFGIDTGAPAAGAAPPAVR